MERVIFQSSDLARERTKVISAARAGRAVVRDKDGTGLVMLPEADLAVLEGYAKWSQILQRLRAFLQTGREVSLAELGELAWLRFFDLDDRREFAEELHNCLIAGLADHDLTAVNEAVHAWQVTARQLEDPLRRTVLLGMADAEDFAEVTGPQE